jgi:hypothetical protein
MHKIELGQLFFSLLQIYNIYIYIYITYFAQLAIFKFTSCAYKATALSFSVVKLLLGPSCLYRLAALNVFGLF